MTDAIARLHEIALELRCIAEQASREADQITRRLPGGMVGIGMSDKLQGGDIPLDGFVPLEPADAGPAYPIPDDELEIPSWLKR